MHPIVACVRYVQCDKSFGILEKSVASDQLRAAAMFVQSGDLQFSQACPASDADPTAMKVC